MIKQAQEGKSDCNTQPPAQVHHFHLHPGFFPIQPEVIIYQLIDFYIYEKHGNQEEAISMGSRWSLWPTSEDSPLVKLTQGHVFEEAVKRKK
ncbi:hypothetical protein ACFS7Z_19810 [Pontibacter toksunensis]|uniref:Uncharacterized protein n=1 Tax=Pontibacter toksunensis TaxID=1332631 RepID=A0ABW6BZU9_9BACT